MLAKSDIAEPRFSRCPQRVNDLSHLKHALQSLDKVDQISVRGRKV